MRTHVRDVEAAIARRKVPFMSAATVMGALSIRRSILWDMTVGDTPSSDIGLLRLQGTSIADQPTMPLAEIKEGSHIASAAEP